MLPIYIVFFTALDDVNLDRGHTQSRTISFDEFRDLSVAMKRMRGIKSCFRP
jgi:hypothetical protein